MREVRTGQRTEIRHGCEDERDIPGYEHVTIELVAPAGVDERRQWRGFRAQDKECSLSAYGV